MDDFRVGLWTALLSVFALQNLRFRSESPQVVQLAPQIVTDLFKG